MTEHQDDDDFVKRDEIWERFLFSILLLVLFALVETLMWLMTAGQVLWMLFNKNQANDNIAEFGARLCVWLKRAAMYLSGTTDDKPFPWREID